MCDQITQIQVAVVLKKFSKKLKISSENETHLVEKISGGGKELNH